MPCPTSDLGAQHGDLGFLPESHQDTESHQCHREASWTLELAEMKRTGKGLREFNVVGKK